MERILIVDDDKGICEGLRLVLSDLADIDTCNTVLEAKKCVSRIPNLKLILVDYRIKNDSGIDFYLKEVLKKNRHIPAILMSGYVGENKHPDLIESAKSHFEAIIEKPFDVVKLRALVMNLL